MGSEGERRSYSRILALTGLFTIAVCSCSIGRVYMGSEIKENPRERIVIGSTTKSEILEIFGPPEHVQSQYDGDLFIYAYLRKNSSTLTLAEPFITNISIFKYNRIQQKRDSLIILFDKNGVVKSYGYYVGTTELQPL